MPLSSSFNPITRNPSNVAEVAAPVLKEFVSNFSWDKSSLDCFAIFVQTRNFLTETFCLHRVKVISVFRYIGR